VNLFNLSLVPLRQASLCIDCETITTAQTNCYACGSRALLNIARALDQQRPSTACSGATAVVQMYPRVRQRNTFHGSGSNLGRIRNRESGLSRSVRSETA
jgi:hypothetical protein